MEYTASRDKSSYTFLFGQNPEDRSSCYHCVQLFVRTVNILEKRECKYSHTVWKFQDFSITQILCEIKFMDSRSAKSALLTHLEALKFL